MKSLISLWSVAAQDCAARCGTSTTLDINTVKRRVENEGVSFFTITLPAFADDFQRSLDDGLVSPKSFLSFRKTGSCLPSFLRGFMENVFHSSNGVLRSDPSIDCIFSIRQLTLIYSKIDLPCSPNRVKATIDGYVRTDDEVLDWENNVSDSDISEFERMSSLLFRKLFSQVDYSIYSGAIVPKHGPGAVADKLTSNGKLRSLTWTDRLQDIFPAEEFLFPNARYFSEYYDQVNYLEPGSEIPVKVITVPKTMKGPRIIAIEPACMQYTQQGILSEITRGVKDSYLDTFIGFDSQVPNQELCRSGSHGSLATLDLSEASDRVPFKLIKAMLHRHPLTMAGVDACRSRWASVPGHGDIPLAKFASMGSALCFPFEAMVFLTCLFLGIEKESGHRFVSTKDIIPYANKVRVFGDDIIVPVDYVHTCIESLELFGAKVNPRKSFWIGRFRESCGKEYYDGHDVSICRLRHVPPTCRQQAIEVNSLSSFRNLAYWLGLWKVASYIDDRIKALITYYPIVESTSRLIGRESVHPAKGERICDNLHRPLCKGMMLSSRSPSDPLDGYPALLKFFLSPGNPDENHLKRAGRPRSVHIKTGWAPPF